jgi:hypothetical protein
MIEVLDAQSWLSDNANSWTAELRDFAASNLPFACQASAQVPVEAFDQLTFIVSNGSCRLCAALVIIETSGQPLERVCHGNPFSPARKPRLARVCCRCSLKRLSRDRGRCHCAAGGPRQACQGHQVSIGPAMPNCACCKPPQALQSQALGFNQLLAQIMCAGIVWKGCVDELFLFCSPSCCHSSQGARSHRLNR